MLPLTPFTGGSKGLAPALPQVVEQPMTGLAVGDGQEGKPSGQRSLICRESSGERKLRRFREGRHRASGSFQKRRLEPVFRCWAIGRDPTSVTIGNARKDPLVESRELVRPVRVLC